MMLKESQNDDYRLRGYFDRTPEELAKESEKKSAELCAASCRTIDFERRTKTLGWLCKDETTTECKNYKEVVNNMKSLCDNLKCK